MEFSGSQVIKAPLEQVFAFVIDPNKVGWCGPGVYQPTGLAPKKRRRNRPFCKPHSMTR